MKISINFYHRMIVFEVVNNILKRLTIVCNQQNLTSIVKARKIHHVNEKFIFEQFSRLENPIQFSPNKTNIEFVIFWSHSRRIRKVDVERSVTDFLTSVIVDFQNLLWSHKVELSIFRILQEVIQRGVNLLNFYELW